MRAARFDAARRRAAAGRNVLDAVFELCRLPPEPQLTARLLARAHRTTLLRRHVILPPDIAKEIPKNTLMSEDEWRGFVEFFFVWFFFPFCMNNRWHCGTRRA